MSRGDNVQGIFGVISRFWAKWGWDESRGARVLILYDIIHATFRQLRNGRFSPNLVTKHASMSRRGIRKDIFETMGYLPKKSEIESRSNRQLAQSRLQVRECTADRYCLLHVVVQGPRSFRDRLTFLYDVHNGSELRGVKIAQFSDFRLFSPYKTPKT